MEDVEELLAAVEGGDEAARRRLFDLLYEELRTCAHRQRRGAGQTLSTTTLVHETYIKLASRGPLRLSSRQHFMAVVARAMRQLLVDHARRVHADKRGGNALHVTFGGEAEGAAEQAAEAAEVLALDLALAELEETAPRAARVVNLHFFGGLGFAAIAELEGINERTVKRDWQAARLMLAAAMHAG